MRFRIPFIFGRTNWRRRRFVRTILAKLRLTNVPTPVLWSRIVFGIFILFVAGLLGVAGLFLWFAKDLPRPGEVQRTSGFSTVITDRNGEKLYDLFESENRIPLKNLSSVPKYLRDATIAVEDKNFYTHSGLSSTGILRSVFNIVLYRQLQGGSTLTQQLVKNVLLSQERTLPRKMKEAILAVQIESKYSKDEILQMYLSETPYGGPSVGVVAASEYYFGKPPSELTLVESAFMAGMPQSPTQYNPLISDGKEYVWRTEQVLRRMREDSYITSDEEAKAKKDIASLSFKGGVGAGLRAPHFIAYIRELLKDKIGESALAKGGFTVTTTLDWKLQEKAQSIVKEEVEKVSKLKVGNGAAVILDPTNGEILAMIGSKDYMATESGGYQFNVATQGLRQPGSSIKPFAYATALASGYTPATLLLDTDTKYPSGKPEEKEYNPKNYDGKFRGPVQLRYALANSINTIAVKVTALVGVKNVLKTAYDMGIMSLEPTDENLKNFGLSLALGGGEVRLLDLTSAYGVFATGGMRTEPIAIKKIEDMNGKILFEEKPPKLQRVMKEDVMYLISDILSENDARKEIFGTNSLLVIPGKTVAVKTGTTDDKRDNWTMGYTPTRVVGVWVGNNDNTPMNQALASGVTGAAPIWNRLMKEALTGMSDSPFKKPDSITEVTIDAYGGGLTVSDRPTRAERFIKGTEPTSVSPIYKRIKVSKRDNKKLANSVEITKGEFDERPFVVFVEDDPVSGDGKNRWQEGINSWVDTQTDERLKVPRETYSGDDVKIAVRFRKPGGGQKLSDNNVTVIVEANGIKDIKEIRLYVNGQERAKSDGKSLEANMRLDNGSYTLKARARDNDGNEAEDSIQIGVNQDYTPSVTPAPTSAPTSVPPTPTNTSAVAPSPTP